MTITSFELHRVHLPLSRPIGDSQVRFDDHWISVLELHTERGLTGLGFDVQQGTPTPPLAAQIERFQHTIWPAIRGGEPLALALRIERPRGGNVGGGYLASLAVETALWDLAAKQAGLSLYRLLGGTDPQVPAYGSTLDFHLDDEAFRERLGEFQRMGFRAMKIKMGHPELAWELRRMAIVREIFGPDVTLLVDANEAWSPKEALVRVHAWRDAGFVPYWVEDPLTREDYAGYRRLCAELPFTRINTGEYLGFSGKRRLLEHSAVDVLNLHGSVSVTRAAALLAGDYGVPVSLGNTLLEIGVHLAASLPECMFLEYSDLPWNRLVVEPVAIRDGIAHAPDRPGHGLTLDRAALAEYSRP